MIYTILCTDAKSTGASILALIASGKPKNYLRRLYGVHADDVFNNIDKDYVHVIHRNGKTLYIHKRKPEQFVVITDWELQRIKGPGKLTKIGLYAILKTYMNSKNGCGYPSMRTLAKRCLISERQVARIIKQLKEYGLIEIVKCNGHNIYIFNVQNAKKRLPKMSGGLAEDVIPIDRKCHAKLAEDVILTINRTTSRPIRKTIAPICSAQ